MAPPTTAGQVGSGQALTPDATGGVIPYKNPAALIGYYLGVFGLVPALGVPLALAAVILGTIGLVRRKKGLAIGGLFHGIIAIVLGLLSLGYHIAFVAFIYVN
ncbi:MAG: hypothetical protein KIT54_02710 [Phycisphaeraceae bacterium]|nr:hypothetical protein [Phycisphaeraceae bacterium]